MPRLYQFTHETQEVIAFPEPVGYNAPVNEVVGEKSALDFFPANRTPRPEQIQAIQAVEKHFDLGAKVVALQAPTGSGKSFCAMSFANKLRAANQRTHLITVQKNLMDQYSSNFKSPELEPVKGRSNYSCSFDKDDPRDASNGYCRRVGKAGILQECLKFGTLEQAQKLLLPPEAHSCDYWAQVSRAAQSPVAMFNFHSFLYQQRLNRFGPRDLLILDECHNTEQVLLQFVQVVLSDRILRKINIELDLGIKTAEGLVQWLERERIIPKILEALGDSASGEAVADDLTPQDTDRLRNLLDRLGDLQKYMQLTEWVIDVTEEFDEEDPTDKTRKLRARPVFVGLFAKELIFSKATRTIAMSATILSHKIWAKNLGIRQADLGYSEIPCSFPVQNRPLILEYAGDMSWKNLDETLPKTYATIQRILERHKGQRGIIHGHSERLCKLILENVRSPRFLHLDMFTMRNKSELLKKHAERPDSVIVASAMHEGVDLIDDLARFQIIAKIPWPSIQDPLVKARMAVDGSFLAYQTALKITQASGRIVRHKNDHGITYITDLGFEKFLSRSGWLLPKWFTEAIQRKTSP